MASSPSRAVKLFGTDQSPAEQRILTAGPLSVVLEAGNLRYIRLNGVEAIRAISYIARDDIWGTYDPAISNMQVQEDHEGFRVSYDAVCKDDRQEIAYRAEIIGSRDGSLRFEATAEAATDFSTNRVGFVILHGNDGIAGRPTEVLHVDGTVENAIFPELVEPWQPFFDMRAISHEVMPGCKVTCRMEGDTWEMEDQRNWTDDSYKTYSRPLALPMPYTIAAKEPFAQSVTLTLNDQLTPYAAAADSVPVKVSVGEETGRMPRIGLGVHPRHAIAALDSVDLVKGIGPQVLVCHFDPRDGHGAGDLQRFGALGQATGAELVLEAIVPCDGQYTAELDEIAAAVKRSGIKLTAVTVAPGPDLIAGRPFSDWPRVPPLSELFDAARARFPGVLIGGGSYSYFTEMNRRRPDPAHLDFITHVTCAIVHAADDQSLMETIACLPTVIKTVRSMAGGKPYRVGPAGLGSRHAPFGGEPTANPDNIRVTMTRSDPRQRSLAGAAWHLGYAAQMAAGGIDVLSLSSPVGEFGLIHSTLPYGQPWYDEAGGVFPSYHVMAGMAAAAGEAHLATTVSADREVQAVAHRSNGGTTLWLANLTGGERQVEIDGLAPSGGRLCLLDEDSFEQCAGGPDDFSATARTAPGDRVTLGAYAVARIDAPA